MMDDMELYQEFTKEAREYMDNAEPLLIELIQSGADASDIDESLINDVFRLFHSLKGGAGFLNLAVVAGLTHEAETLLDMIRGGKMLLSQAVIQEICNAIDLLRDMFDGIEHTGDDTEFAGAAKEIEKALIKLVNEGLGLDEVAAEIEETSEATPETPTEVPEKEAAKETPQEAEEPVFDFPIEIEITEDMKLVFFQEAADCLDGAEQTLLALTAKAKGDDPGISEAFRHLHSFKGNCAFMGLHDLNRLGHLAETILDEIRHDKMEFSEQIRDLQLELIDMMRNVVRTYEETGKGDVPSLDVCETLFTGFISDEAMAEVDAISPPASRVKQASAAKSQPKEKPPEETPKKEEVKAPKPAATPAATPPATPAATPPATPAKKSSGAKSGGASQPAKTATAKDIRVDLTKLDALMNLVGELVIAEAMVTGSPAVADIADEHYDKAKHQMRRICDDLQDIAMSIRMIPLAATFRKMKRLVHDVSNKAQKEINLELIGENTEVDKTVIEMISDPLVHIIRNSCDHGIETPAERKAAGKTPQGTVTIEAKHEGGEVWIAIRDDGRGLARDKILAKAIERGLVTPDEEYSDSHVYRLIFEPGFSTAEKITDISGRGVGMDVVKRNIESVNGRIDVESEQGTGTTITLRIPLTMAIINGMLISVGDSFYTIPMLGIRESLRPTPQEITVTPDNAEILRLRDEFIPIMRLKEVFQHESGADTFSDGILIVLEDAGVPVAILVDEIIGQRQTVIKGLSEYVGSTRACSGCTILGDGSISLILDIRSFVDMANDVYRTSGRVFRENKGFGKENTLLGKENTLLGKETQEDE